ncbi:MAG: M48 family metallopeptidase [Candidatus Omnitrophota bacterium]
MPDKNNDARGEVTPQQAKQYQAIKNRLFLFGLLLNCAFLLALVVTGWSRQIKIFLLNMRDDFLSINALYFCVFSALAFALSLPLSFYEGYILEHRYNLSCQSKKAWFADVLKHAAIALVVSLILVEGVYFFLSEFSSTWWLWAAGLWFFVSVVLARIFPKLILPLFFKPKPLEDGALRQRITALLDRYAIKLKDVYVLDFSKKTVKANAMVAGLGRTKQIYLSDTLIAEFPPEEIEIVLAHEVGHYVARDTFKLVAAGLVSALVSFFAAKLILEQSIAFFGFRAVSDIASLPLFLLVLMLIGLILLPLQNGFSRFLERRADLFALKATRAPEVFIAMMERLGKKNFSDFSPSRLVEIFLYDHPPIAKRIQLAREEYAI